MNLNHLRIILGLVTVLIPVGTIHSEDSVAGQRLNVVLFLVDDLGWTDLACFGSRLYQTPNIDRLAREGVRFSNAYSPACSCSPSRGAIMTGKFPARTGMTAIVEKHRGDKAPNDALLLPATTLPALPDHEVTIAEVLSEHGYATGLVGKWHLGDRTHNPKDHGFDVAVGAPHAGAPRSYFWPQWKGSPELEGRREGEYLTDRLADEAIEFIQTHHQQPVFLCLSFHSVHVPIEAKSEKVAKYQSLLRSLADSGQITAHFNPHYAAMIESMDEAVGRVTETMRQLQLDDNTLFLVFSDNGGLAHPSHRGEHTPATTNRPLRSGKGFLYEGGIRVPLIVRWPKMDRGTGLNTTPVHGCDLFPTICDAASIALDQHVDRSEIDGISLLHQLQSPDSKQPDRTLYWHYPHFSSMGGRPSGAMRQGDWKLIENFESGELELFNLADDPGESSNLAKTFPERTSEMHRALQRWQSDMQALRPERPNPGFIHGASRP